MVQLEPHRFQQQQLSEADSQWRKQHGWLPAQDSALLVLPLSDGVRSRVWGLVKVNS